MTIRQAIGVGGLVGALALCAGGAWADNHVDAAKIEAAFLKADDNGDGVVNIDEFVGYVIGVFDGYETNDDGMLSPSDVQHLTAARFGEIDRDGDGMMSVGEAVSDAMLVFFKADANRDGVLTLDEILAFEAKR